MKNATDIPVLSDSRPVLGHLLEMVNERVGFIEHVAREQLPLVRAKAMLGEVLVVCDPELARTVLADEAQAYEKTNLTKFCGAPLGGEGLFLSEGALWKRQRKLVAPLFHQQFLERYADEMCACIRDATGALRDGMEVSVPSMMTDVTMQIAMLTLFGTSVSGETRELGAAITDTLEWAASNAPSAYAFAHVFARRALDALALTTPAPLSRPLHRMADSLRVPRFFAGRGARELQEALRILDQRVYRMIATRKRALAAGDRAPEDVLTRLLLLRDELNQPLDDVMVRDEVLTLFGAAHETTANALSWTIQLLAQHPTVYSEVAAEARALPDVPSFASLGVLEATRRAFKEALRLYPPLYLLGRQAREDTVLGGYRIPKGTALTICVYALHRNAQHWPTPEQFLPERFLPAAEAARSKYAWIPFGMGPRVCIGAQFALQEGTLLLASLLRRWDFSLVERGHMQPAMSLRPSPNMRIRIAARVDVTD